MQTTLTTSQVSSCSHPLSLYQVENATSNSQPGLQKTHLLAWKNGFDTTIRFMTLLSREKKKIETIILKLDILPVWYVFEATPYGVGSH